MVTIVSRDGEASAQMPRAIIRQDMQALGRHDAWRHPAGGWCRISKIPLPVIPTRAFSGPIEDGVGERGTCLFFVRKSGDFGNTTPAGYCHVVEFVNIPLHFKTKHFQFVPQKKAQQSGRPSRATTSTLHPIICSLHNHQCSTHSCERSAAAPIICPLHNRECCTHNRQSMCPRMNHSACCQIG